MSHHSNFERTYNVLEKEECSLESFLNNLLNKPILGISVKFRNGFLKLRISLGHIKIPNSLDLRGLSNTDMY